MHESMTRLPEPVDFSDVEFAVAYRAHGRFEVLGA